jgi:chloramphenicol 3-O-phosphotransferase
MFLNTSKSARLSDKLGNLILFDGTSCAGKTSICRNIDCHTNVPYHYVALDDFITDVFEEQKLRPRPPREFVAACNERTESMYLHIDSMVNHGSNVLCDTTLTCLEDTTNTHRWFSIINNINNTLVLVYCPFDAVVKRLQQRNHHARIEHQPRNSRITSVVLRQFIAMFKAQSHKSRLVIDELPRTHIEKAFELVRDDFADAHQFQSLRTEIMSKLGLFDHKRVFISPRLFYDYVINTNLYPIEKCAQLIAKNLNLNLNSSSHMSNHAYCK